MNENSENSATVKILVVDDHPAVREALALHISRHPDMAICGEAEDSTAALRLCDETNPDVVITDITLKKSDGIDLIKRVLIHHPSVRVLVWSMHSEHLYAERALRAGALGYITKEHATEQIIHAIRQIRAGKVSLSPAMRERLLSRMVDGGERKIHSPMDDLTDRELVVFRLLGQGIKTQGIADQLHLSVKTVETHRDRIKKKLHLRDASDLLRNAVLWVQENA